MKRASVRGRYIQLILALAAKGKQGKTGLCRQGLYVAYWEIC